jgi:hypothetical protein
MKKHSFPNDFITVCLSQGFTSASRRAPRTGRSSWRRARKAGRWVTWSGAVWGAVVIPLKVISTGNYLAEELILIKMINSGNDD